MYLIRKVVKLFRTFWDTQYTNYLVFGDILRVLSLKLVGTPGTFKLLVIVKLILGVVLFLTGEVIYAWSSGQLRQEKELALANFKNQLMEASTNDSTDP